MHNNIYYSCEKITSLVALNKADYVYSNIKFSGTKLSEIIRKYNRGQGVKIYKLLVKL